MKQAFGHVGQIARLTFLEAVRQRFFNFLVILSLALIGSANFFRQFDFGSSELKFVANFGTGGILFFGSILAVVTTAQLFFGEIENRTALTMLAKPVRRWAFIAGKLLGVCLLLFVFVALLTALLGAFLWWRQGQLMDEFVEKFPGDVFPASQQVQFTGLALDGLLQWLKFDVLAAITMLVASFSNTNLYTVAVSFFIMLICQLQYIAHDSWKSIENPVLQGMAWLLGVAFPNFQVFSVGDLLIFPQNNPVPPHVVAEAAGYGVIYVLVFLGLAVVSFLTREI
jgi:ABC-type transport system involved in multi-copper enzyme maturation permease subunit